MSEASDEYLDERNALAADNGTFPNPCPPYVQLKQDQIVGEAAQHIALARSLPTPVYNFILRAVMAEREAEPARMEKEREKAERLAQEDKDRRDALDEQ